ncbi:Aminopeptidase YwaD precursor [Planctomycetes bacterium Pla163]|uniref:Aminopeptidase YwaD n=1 Tax=Rohdeia mirabilis TaxID=2528008 RepID=A0A518CZA7_9BACT|nr:Aminopeptidase YwaD precursor [Planctomycetes bacterium Pla163]
MIFKTFALPAVAVLGSSLGLLTAPAQAAVTFQEGDPISAAIEASSDQVREYNMHLTFLSSPFLEGRLPGTRGMEIAKDYVEQHFMDRGLAAPFVDAEGNPSYRQDFPISEQTDLTDQSLRIGDRQLVKGKDYMALSLGGAGVVTAPAVFVGYSIDKGRDGYSSFEEGDSLVGKIAVMLRFEPMKEDGTSQWRDSGWSARAGYSRKVADAADRGAAGVIIINTPGADDERVDELPAFRYGGRARTEVPVMTMSAEAGERLIAKMGPQGTTLMDLRREADAGRSVHDLEGTIEMVVQTETRQMTGQNVCGLVPGKGDLAGEIVVIGAHLDHLGMGDFGSRYQGPPAVHPGADDNASGSAAMIMLAERFTQYYASLPEGASARTILIQCYDAEEQGLIGAGYYTRNPIRSIEDHVLMLNFDMIGRITDDGGMSVTGLGSGRGLKAFAQPFMADTPLKLVPGDGVMAASDHWMFHQAGVPTLMGICSPLHEDYHTPRDTADRINRVNAVHAMNLWGDICLAAAQHPERFEHNSSPGTADVGRPGRPVRQDPATEPAPAPSTGAGPASTGVRLGVQPGNYGETGKGVVVERVSVDSPAARAGIVDGDRIVKWGGETLADVDDMITRLQNHDPDDVVEIEVERGTETIKISVTLEAKG